MTLAQLTGPDVTTFWVILEAGAELQAAPLPEDWAARGQVVVEHLQATAQTSQAELRELLENRGVAYQSFWITNAIRVTAPKAMMQELAARPEVKRIVSDGVYFIPPPLPGETQPRPQGIEWNIDRVRTPEAWATFDTRGEGIIVANIDTGVQFDGSVQLLVMSFFG
jgi:hypothetical protein